MNVVNTSDLRPGQMFSEPVYSESDYMLVSANVPLRQRDIDVLNTWGIEYVRTDGVLLDNKPKQNIPTQSSEQILKALEEQIRNAIGDSEEPPEHEEVQEAEEEEKSSEKESIKFSLSDVRHNSGP